MPIVEDVLNTVLSLPVADRAVLAERLLASLDDLDEDESDLLWGEEAERRLAALRKGKARAWPAEEVYARAEQLLSE
ncbi:addiction module protein [uncultured Thiodictyon sp.]|jgi:putative addiction module component (TIGR02574 family)|uniref:addiction module protein n=1 Tax=uncultured Thiodictyon sp. TaxID=1846217 RepID=UPI0025FD55A8|nr:addiction module protein [uncultured Thiodictyon sp.]